MDIQFSDGSASYGSADETDAGTCALSVENNASLILNLSGENTLKSGAGRAGIHVAENASLTIRGDGKLTVTGGNCAAGIGGGLWNNAGNITIEGGTIEATGGSDGAGIGGGHANDALINGQSHRYGGFQSISITGGTVTARSPGNGAGIGTGCWSAQAGTISMENAIVTVSTAGTAGTCAAIGQGYHGSNSAEKVSIKITGSVITATNVNGAQISGGEDPATIENSLGSPGRVQR